MSNKLKSGNDSPKTATYKVVGPRGGATGDTARVPKGNIMPPTPKPNQSFVKKGK